MRIHTGEKPYPCPQGYQAFSQSPHLKSHQKTHSGVKIYFCSNWAKSFSQSQHLKDNMRVPERNHIPAPSVTRRSLNLEAWRNTRGHTAVGRLTPALSVQSPSPSQHTWGLKWEFTRESQSYVLQSREETRPHLPFTVKWGRGPSVTNISHYKRERDECSFCIVR